MFALVLAICGAVTSVVSAVITFVVNRRLKMINDCLHLRIEELEKELKEVK